MQPYLAGPRSSRSKHDTLKGVLERTAAASFFACLRPIGATVARQIPVLKVTRSNRVSVSARRYNTQACRRNTKKEKRQRNQENMRKFKKGAPPTARGGGGKKKTMSRKKLTLKAQAAVEKGREATFMSKLFLATGGALEEKLDLGVL